MDVKNFRRYNLVFWAIVFVPLTVITLFFVLAASGKLGYMPRTDDLQNPKINLATLIISEDNEILGSLYTKNQNRTYVDFERLPTNLVDALIASEDVRFYRHSGIDYKGTFRAVAMLGSRGGGSTITQQLAKQLFHNPAQNFVERLLQKLKEYIIAVKLEKSYTKNEIIALYFNQYDFLYNAVGINSAAQIYFNKIPDSLKIEESAILVGMAQNPSLFNPVRRPALALEKRNRVFGQMKKYGYISQAEFDSLKKLPVKLDFQPSSHNVGPATYFREYIKQYMTYKKPRRKNYNNYSQYQGDSAQWADDPLFGWCNKQSKPDGSHYDIYTDGLRIYTTINYKMQLYAEEAVKVHLGGYLQDEFFKEKKGRKRAPFSADLTNEEIDKILRHAIRWSDRGKMLFNQGMPMSDIFKEFKKPVAMKVFSWDGDIDTVMSPLDSILYYKHFLRTGFMAMDPHTGFVKAYVGGINFRHFKYDMVTQGKRQAGSTFKPFLYILAMQEGYSPCYEVPVVPVRFKVNDTIWEPRSTCSKEDLGTLKPLKWGLARSENYISAFMVSLFKPQPIADIAYKMGIESYIDPVPSMIYGTSDMSVKEMVGAYSTFANKGVHTSPVFVTRIEDKFGNVLATFQPESKEGISEETAYLMLNLMQGVVDFGTAARLRYKYQFTADIAGKTGTTNNHSDGWFIGIAPKLVAGAWVGAEDRSVHFNNLAMGSGTSMALPVWAEFMQRVYADSSLGILQSDVFEKPLNISLDLNCGGQNSMIEQYLKPGSDFDLMETEDFLFD
ncbi:MAG: transglycosylase domain-containing protein [Bacteroidales bacterium]|nr:transglycosylase domain-containing protein [Bacteroidales bacterium]